MKSTVFVFLFVSTVFTTFAQTFTDAAKYNDYIVDQQNLVGKNLLSFFEKFGDGSLTKADILNSLEELLQTAKGSVSAVQQITAFDGETQLKQASVELFKFYVQTIDTDYREVVNLVYDSGMDDAATARLNAIMEKVQAEEAVYDENFTHAQVAFAEKYDFVLGDNELQDEIDKN